MIFGTVNFFRNDKGFGFLTRDDREPDVFVHVFDLQRSGLDGLEKGQRVEFDIMPDRRDASGQKMRAVDIRLVGA
jgi:CspA family cold shock protein